MILSPIFVYSLSIYYAEFCKSKTVIIRTLNKIFVGIVGVFLLLLLLLLLVLNSYRVQTFLAHQLTQYISKQWNTEVVVEKVEIDFPNQLILKNILIEDLQKDTLFFIRDLELKIIPKDWSFQDVEITSLNLVDPYFNYYSMGEGTNNLNAFLNQFSGNGEKRDSAVFSADQIKIQNGRFNYHLYDKSDTILNQIDFNHLEVDSVFLSANDLKLETNQLTAIIESLSLKEESGFEIDQLAALFTMNDSLMDFQNLHLKTPNSNVIADYAMAYQNYSDFNDFIHAVHLSSEFKNSKIATSDIGYFTSELQAIDVQFNLNGKVRGPIDNLKGRNITLSINDAVYLNGRFDLRGLPNVEETYIYMKLEQLTTSMKGLSTIPFPSFENNNRLNIPNNMFSLGELTFKGEFTGFYNDFVSYGILDTELGRVKTDLLLSEDSDGLFNYSGDIYSQNFQIGSMIDFSPMSKVGLDVTIEGKGTSIENAKASISGKIQSLNLYDYEYTDITVEGNLSKEKFQGKLSLRDENLKFDFNGLLDISQKQPIYNFDFNLIESKLAQLNLFRQSDTLTNLKLNANFNAVGSSIDNVYGEVILNDIRYSDSRFEKDLESIHLSSEGDNLNRTIALSSNLVDAKIEGNVYFDELYAALINHLNQYMSSANTKTMFQRNQAFSFEAKLKNITPITDIFFPELVIADHTSILGQFNSESQFSKLVLNSPSVGIKKNVMEDLNLEFNTNKDSVSLALLTKSTAINRLHFYQSSLKSTLNEGSLESQFNWFTDSMQSNDGNIKLSGEVFTLDSILFSLKNSYFYLGDSLWEFLTPNAIQIAGSNLQVEHLTLKNFNQSMTLDGRVGNSNEDSLEIQFSNMQLQYLSNLLPKEIVDLNGVVDGNSTIRKYNDDYAISSDLAFSDLSINQSMIGDSYIKSEWMPDQKAFNVQASLGDEETKAFSITGSVYPFEENNSLDLSLSFNQTPIEVLRPYLTDYVTEVDGTINGQLKIEGKTTEPLIEGTLKLTNTEFRVIYLNTKYFIDDEIVIRPDFIGFDLIKIKDENGKTAIGTGTIFHNNYSGFNLDIGLEFNSFLALNTNSTQNQLYYGKAIASGSGNISGYADQLIIEFNAATEKGTIFNVPITTDVEASNLDFIQFTNSHIKVEEKQEVDLRGIQMNFDLKVKPETKIRLIFDEQVGDVMNGTGEGNIKLEINTLGDFNMFGKYTVSKGDYLFTLQNIINKRFNIAPGSSVSWDGDPYEAKIDIKAIYNLRASLYDLIPDDSTINTKRRVPVELELQLTENLLNPDIGFDIRLPNSNENIRRQLESILYLNSTDMNKQEVNQQVFGLLVLNRFLPPSSGIVNQNQVDRGAPGVNNGYELISNQLSNWLSKVSSQFDIGINYRPGDEIANEELDLSLSTEVLNERLILDGNFGYSNANNTIEDEQNSTNFIGEFSAEYKISKDGRFRLRGFNRSANNNLLQNFSPYTQGIGVFYRKEFDTFEELWRSYFSKSNDD